VPPRRITTLLSSMIASVTNRDPAARKRLVRIIAGAIVAALVLTVAIVVYVQDASRPVMSEHPVHLDEVRSDYSVDDGTIELDLTALPKFGAVRTTVHVGRGDVRIIVAVDADVDAFCSAEDGAASCLDQTGPEVHATGEGVDGPGGLSIHLEASSGAGLVDVRRG
jgi:hypothetical protein